ncbi:putative paired amphipathic helix protein [Phaeoacremonium minimum UCRPA7]|uniref:Putative paired amphipathic helix protein n=1 Tax=Phaeoacremonium minimum (strain UCR-PA7) TaxID=1286976 RepID=R8BN18_PHAM7|nr:putative paired amphipathic helix protein [Phaeoacremonium minimum UCRPA7]EOO00680.1 putative paired amphipathic helix protein [Phaeoacremonium minimum UCRPA7]
MSFSKPRETNASFPPPVFLCGTIPLLIIAYTTSPFVAWVHLRLPPYARHSREVLQRFARTMPPNTRLQVTTMNMIGKPRVSDMTVSDLRPAHQRLGVVNYVRDTALENAARPWWMFRAVGRFSIQRASSGTADAKEGWVWREVADGIARRQEQQQARK